ncbi:hypothetical protein PAMP_002583 [Pampus punctatissimus]
MEEEEINYASVVFKTKTHSPREDKQEEETVYDEVKAQNQPAEEDVNINTGFLPYMKISNRRHHCQKVTCCLGIHCIILLLAIITTCVYFNSLINLEPIFPFAVSKYNRESELKETSLLVINHNLTDQNNKLSSENEHLKEKSDNLTVHVNNLTQAYTVLESKLINLTAENQELKTRNQELETQRNNLTEQIQNTEIKWNEQSVTRAQWSVDAYCPIKNNIRQCKPCQDGWLLNQSSCYAINNPKNDSWRTWEEAREDCRGKISDLAVIDNEDAKKFINNNSWNSSGTKGYWIGLRVEDGRWKWINGSDLTKTSWIDSPTNGSCAISVLKEEWKSVSCGEKQQWVCRKKALSV